MDDIKEKVLALNPEKLDQQLVVKIEDMLLDVLIEWHEGLDGFKSINSRTKLDSIRSKVALLKGNPAASDAKVIIDNILSLLE